MANTVKTSIVLSKPQRDAMKARAEQKGIAMPELIRRALDEWLEIKAKQEKDQ